MNRKLLVFSMLLLALPASDAAARTRDEQLAQLALDLRVLARIVDVSKDLEQQRQVIDAILAERIEMLREPKGDGTYRWARLQREEEGRVTHQEAIERVSTERELQRASVSAPRAYRLMVVVPPKRNLISSNNRVYVKSAVLEWTAFDGTLETTELPIDAWVNPGETHAVALPAIAKSAKASLNLGVESGSKKAVAEVALLQAKLVDDESSPYFPAVRRLLDIRRRAADEKIRRGDLESAIDEALLAIPGELDKRAEEQRLAAERLAALAASGALTGTVAAGDATPDVIAAIRAAAKLLDGPPADQAKGRARLQELLEKLSPSRAD